MTRGPLSTTRRHALRVIRPEHSPASSDFGTLALRYVDARDMPPRQPPVVRIGPRLTAGERNLRSPARRADAIVVLLERLESVYRRLALLHGELSTLSAADGDSELWVLTQAQRILAEDARGLHARAVHARARRLSE